MSQSVVDKLAANYFFKVFAAFELRPNDHLVAITDPGVDEDCRIALEIAINELQLRGHSAELVVSAEPAGPAQAFEPEVEEKMRYATALLYHSGKYSRSHCPQTHKFLPGKNPDGTLKAREDGRPQARLISITNGKADTLLNGAVNEDLVAMRERIDRINNLTKGVQRFYITTKAGTDLWVTPWPEKSVVDNGIISEPGQLGNFPFGEGCSCAVKFYGTDGVLVSDGVIGAGIGQVDKPITMRIKNGKITSMTGGTARDRLVKSMDEADRKMPQGFLLAAPSCYIAEVAFGMNAAAWRTDENGKKVLPPTSLEAEKAYDPYDTSIHIAHGANHVFGVPEDDAFFNPVQHHTDHVLCGGVTVDAYFEDGHRMRLINNGRPIY